MGSSEGSLSCHWDLWRLEYPNHPNPNHPKIIRNHPNPNPSPMVNQELFDLGWVTHWFLMIPSRTTRSRLSTAPPMHSEGRPCTLTMDLTWLTQPWTKNFPIFDGCRSDTKGIGSLTAKLDYTVPLLPSLPSFTREFSLRKSIVRNSIVIHSPRRQSMFGFDSLPSQLICHQGYTPWLVVRNPFQRISLNANL